jgi:hypothetical protein
MSEADEPLELPESPQEAPQQAASAEVIDLNERVDPLLEQWARFRDQFADAMGDGFWTVDDLEQKIAHRRAFFFPGKAAALVAEIQTYPGGAQVFQVTWAVGDVAEMIQMAPGIESMARMMGCTSILIEGRKAWEKLLAPLGYTPWSVTVWKAL